MGAQPVVANSARLIIGPARNARLLEIGVVDGDPVPVIVHAMPARDRFLR